MEMTNTEIFCRGIRDRSAEHRSAINLMFRGRLYGQMMSILRQELDSLVRVVFLLNETDLSVREHFISQTLSGDKWTRPNSRNQVTDRNMVDLADQLNGWTQSVYKLGCAFIHLSPMADYKNTNPFSFLPENEKDDIKKHLNYYHDFDTDSELTMETVSPYLSRVFDKIADNLECYIKDLETQPGQ